MLYPIDAAQDGWMGCPHCGRPVNGRLLLLDSNARLLRTLQTEIERRDLLTPPLLALLRDQAQDLEDDKNIEHEGFYPDLCFETLNNAPTASRKKPRKSKKPRGKR